MAGPLLESKTRVPGARPGALSRPRLTQLLAQASRSAVTLVSAPAGFGKTTLLAQWLADIPASGPALAWVSLDARDNDPAQFWTYVVAALRAVEGGVGATALSLLQSPQPSTDEMLATVLNDMHATSAELVLVLDDYHVIESHEVHDGLAFLLEHQPPNLHLVIATRADPPLALARARVRGELVEIRAADLRFTADEAAAYLNGPMGLGLSQHDVDSLEGRTEGWIAALQLAALSMQGRPDASAFIAGFAGDDRYVVDYLAEEVLARQPTDVRDFLLTTSILERLTGPLCDAVTGRGGGKATLVALERANLFLVPLDDTRRWYRYHHLFADVLQAHLVDEYGDEVPTLHRRASVWWESVGDASQAIGHALAGGDRDRAADLMELAMPTMRRERREVELARWVRCLPDEVVAVRPVLGVAFVGALAQVSDFDSVGERLAAIEQTLRPEGGPWPSHPPPGLVVVDEHEFRSVPAVVETYRAALALSQGDLEGTVAHATEALALAPADDDLTHAAAGALGGLASWTTGDLAAAHAAYTETIAGLSRAGSISDVLGCCITLGDIRRVQGRLDEAVQTYRWALDLAAPAPGAQPLRGTADMHVGLAGVLLERDDRASAAEHLARAQGLGEHNGLPQNPYRWRVVMARLREAEGDLDGALELLDEADRVYVGDYSPNVQPVPAVRARLRIRRGELSHADAWARERSLSAADELTYLREFEHLTLARLLLARARRVDDPRTYDEALGLLHRLVAAAESGERGASVVEALVLLALGHQARGDGAEALDTVRRAVSLAEPAGFVRLLADEGAPMASLLKQLGKQTSPYVRRLLASTTGAAPRSTGTGAIVEPLSDRELDVLRLLGSDLDGPDIARELSVSLNTMRTHTKNIYAKLGVTSRRAAVRQAQQLKLLPGPRRG